MERKEALPSGRQGLPAIGWCFSESTVAGGPQGLPSRSAALHLLLSLTDVQLGGTSTSNQDAPSSTQHRGTGWPGGQQILPGRLVSPQRLTQWRYRCRSREVFPKQPRTSPVYPPIPSKFRRLSKEPLLHPSHPGLAAPGKPESSGKRVEA